MIELNFFVKIPLNHLCPLEEHNELLHCFLLDESLKEFRIVLKKIYTISSPLTNPRFTFIHIYLLV
jgi:hypothetical protein